VIEEACSRSPEGLRQRTKQFALRIIHLCRSLGATNEGRIISRQVLRSGTSVAANYRAACRARSRKEFVAKLGIAVEEADETVFWLELLLESRMISQHRLGSLLAEAGELLAILSVSRRTVKSRNRQIAKSPNP